MLQAGSTVRITDNAGGKQGKIFKVLGGSRRRYASIGDLVVLSVKVAEPRKAIKKKDVHFVVKMVHTFVLTTML
jgi:large subunit ribosomal protein L14